MHEKRLAELKTIVVRYNNNNIIFMELPIDLYNYILYVCIVVICVQQTIIYN